MDFVQFCLKNKFKKNQKRGLHTLDKIKWCKSFKKAYLICSRLMPISNCEGYELLVHLLFDDFFKPCPQAKCIGFDFCQLIFQHLINYQSKFQSGH